jgi:Cysteine-rich CPCC
VSDETSGQSTPSDRSRWFAEYVNRLEHESVVARAEEGPHACPCCGYLTLGERGGFEICDVCCWEDDGQDDHDADVVRGGPNGALSLRDARRNFDVIGACEERHIYHVRPPEQDEIPADGSARPLPEIAKSKRRRHRFRDV